MSKKPSKAAQSKAAQAKSERNAAFLMIGAKANSKRQRTARAEKIGKGIAQRM